MRYNNSYHVVKKDALILHNILGLNVCKEIVSFKANELDIYLPKIIRNGFRVAIVENEK